MSGFRDDEDHDDVPWDGQEIDAMIRDEAETRARLKTFDRQIMRAKYVPGLTGKERETIETLTKQQRIAISAVALSPQVIRTATLLTRKALDHLLRRLELPDDKLNPLIKDRIAKIALELAPKTVVAVRELIESTQNAFRDRPAEGVPDLPPEAQKLLEVSREIVGRKAEKKK